MQNNRKQNRMQLNNSGSAIVTAIVIIAFVSILATTILYVAGMNYYMKVTDQRTKECFYEAETAMEQVKSALVAETAEAASHAYEYVSQNYLRFRGTDDAKTQENCQAAFETAFYSALVSNWTADATSAPGSVDHWALLTGKVEDTYRSSLTFDSASAPTGYAGGSIVYDSTNRCAYVYGVRLAYTQNAGGESGYTAIIQTDYKITAPVLTWTLGAAGSPSAGVDFSECVQYVNWSKE